MNIENQFNFLRVKDGQAYFARVTVAQNMEINDVQISAKASAQNTNIPKSWLDAACLGAKKALNAHIEFGGVEIGIIVTSVFGTEVDTNDNTVEIAAFCATWAALGHSDSELIIEFDQQWRVSPVGWVELAKPNVSNVETANETPEREPQA